MYGYENPTTVNVTDDKTATCTITVTDPDQETAEAALAALEATGVENVQGDVKNTKIIENGQLFILRGEKVYTLQGQEVK